MYGESQYSAKVSKICDSNLFSVRVIRKLRQHKAACQVDTVDEDMSDIEGIISQRKENEEKKRIQAAETARSVPLIQNSVLRRLGVVSDQSLSAPTPNSDTNVIDVDWTEKSLEELEEETMSLLMEHKFVG